MGDLYTLIFHDTVSALSEKTLVSDRIRWKFRIHRIQVAFPPGANRLVKIKVFYSPDSNAPSTGEPSGTNLFAQWGPQDYIVGDDALIEFPHRISPDGRGLFLKVYADNEDTYEHTIDVRLTIEKLEEGG